MSSDLDKARLQAALKRIESTTYEVEERSYMDVMLDKLAEYAVIYGWSWTSDEEGQTILQRGKYTITFRLDPLDDAFTGGTLTTDLNHDLDMFMAMKQLGASTEDAANEEKS